MSGPRVNVAIPVFRRPEFVAAAVQSVIAQSYPHWDLTISEDGGSTEAVRRAVEPHLEDERVRYVTPGELMGSARHKEWLTSAGEGEFMTMLDDDDVWHEGWLERRIDFLERHPECGLVWAGHIDIDTQGAEIGRPALPLAGGVHSSREFAEAMLEGNLVATPSVLTRRSTYMQAGGRYETRFVATYDYELWMRMGLIAPVGFLSLYDSSYRVHPQQATRTLERAVDHLNLIDHFDELLAASYPDLRRPPQVRRQQRAGGQLSVALDAAGNGERRRAAQRIISAAGTDPRVLLSRRAAAALAATLAPAGLRRRIAGMRS